MAKKQDIRVIIGVACTDTVKAHTALSLACAIIGKPYVVDFLMRQGGDIVSARTWLVREAIKKEATHILFVDSDMCFSPNTLTKLLSHDKEIVGVEYNKRKMPLEPVHKALEPDLVKGGLYKAEFVGTGLLLINLSVFEKMEEPWFNFGRNNIGELVIGEDVWFCNVARDAGYDVWIDPTLTVKHLGEYQY